MYEPVNEDDLSWIKITNGGVNVQLNRIKGFLPGRITHFLMHLHTMPRSLYMSRHGQSEYNVLGKVGGNSGLSPNGQIYQKALAEWVEVRVNRLFIGVIRLFRGRMGGGASPSSYYLHHIFSVSVTTE